MTHRWYLARTEPQAQYLAAHELARDGFDIFFPRVKTAHPRFRRDDEPLFPGYIFINMHLYREDGSIDDRVWTFIQDTQGIIGFIGGDRPAALTEREVQDIHDQLDVGEEASKPRIEYGVGEMVKIGNGPFENFEGKIESVDQDRGKIKVSVNIFGRSTPVELEYWQVERVDD